MTQTKFDPAIMGPLHHTIDALAKELKRPLKATATAEKQEQRHEQQQYYRALDELMFATTAPSLFGDVGRKRFVTNAAEYVRHGYAFAAANAIPPDQFASFLRATFNGMRGYGAALAAGIEDKRPDTAITKAGVREKGLSVDPDITKATAFAR